MAHHTLQPRRTGVSLIEALVALAVMAFGMLAMVGVQVTLRLNSDVAKQRAEAIRIATDEVDSLRLFTQLVPANGRFAWADIASRGATLAAADTGSNTTYTLTRTVRNGAAAGVGGSLVKVVEVRVTWNDRAGTVQTVLLDTIVTGVHPAMPGLLTAAAQPSAANQRNGRHPSIPDAATPLQGSPGTSEFLPPNSANVSWLFSDLTGALRVCDGAHNNCSAAMFVSGHVAFDLPADGSAVDAVNPRGPGLNLADSPNALTMVSVKPSGAAVSCFADSYGAAVASRQRIPYYCAVMVGPQGWGGQLNPVFATAQIGNGATQVQVCRYTLKNDEFTENADHPKMYCKVTSGTSLTDTPPCGKTRVKANLMNQNFLVIAGDKSCPTDLAADPAAGRLVRYNTLPHQP